MGPAQPILPAAALLRLEAGPTGPRAAPPLPASVDDASRAVVSALAQFIAELTAEESTGLPVPRVPTLATAAADTAQAPERIRQMVQRSGLFYESHLRAWDAGQFPRAELDEEPQAAARRVQAPAAHPPSLPVLLDESAVPEAPAAPATSAAPAAPGAVSVPTLLEPVVRSQLSALATGEAALVFSPWPGQSATLVISEDPEAHDDAAGEAGAPVPRARLRLELPRLGALEIAVSVQGDAVRVAARAEQPGAGGELLAAGGAIRAALEARRLRLDALAADGGR